MGELILDINLPDPEDTPKTPKLQVFAGSIILEFQMTREKAIKDK